MACKFSYGRKGVKRDRTGDPRGRVLRSFQWSRGIRCGDKRGDRKVCLSKVLIQYIIITYPF